MKTGMEMFDACRAYGLGLVIDALSEEPVVLSDLGIYYCVEGQNYENNGLEPEKLMPLIDRNLPWNRVFLTVGRDIREKNEIK